jgi:hypothetical protein
MVAVYWPRASTGVPSPEGGKDLVAYRRIVERVHDGDGYYTAAGEELRAGGYCTSAVFNWRLPTYAWFMGALPRPEWGQAILGILALLAISLAYTSECKEARVHRALAVVVCMIGAFLWCVDGDAYFAQELWAGVLIALSIAAYANGLRVVGIAAGLGALFFRELAGVYVLVCCWAAWCERRSMQRAAGWELLSWAAGLAVFGIFFWWHATQVQLHQSGAEIAETDGWIQFGGPAFVVRTSQMNAWLFRLPGWLAVLYLTASLWGLSTWSGAGARRGIPAVLLYLAAFLVVGKQFNAYWGLLYVAILPFGLVRSLAAIRSLWAAHPRPRPSSPSTF